MSASINNPRARYRLTATRPDGMSTQGGSWFIEDRETGTATAYPTHAAASTAIDCVIRADSIALIEQVRDQWSAWVREHRRHHTISNDEAWAMDVAISALTGALTGSAGENAISDIARVLYWHQPTFADGVGCTGCQWTNAHATCDQHLAHVADVVTQHVLAADLVALLSGL